jgi:membrane protein
MKAIRDLFTQSFSRWNEDSAPRLGASLAFYTILSISPLVLLVVAIVSLVFSRSSAQSLLLAQVQSLIGASGKDAIETMLASGQKPSSGIVSSVLGVVTLVVGASAVFTELRAALNAIWKVEPAKTGSSLWAIARERVFSFGMVISVGFILLVSLLASAGLAAMTKFFSGLLPIAGGFWQVLNFIVSFLAVTLLFALILKYVPEAKIEWRDVRLGAITTALLFTVGKLLLGLYLGKTSPGSAYGAAGSLVVLVIWVYYSAQIFYFGAELTHTLALSREEGAQDHTFQKNAAA